MNALEGATEIVKRLKKAGFKAYFAGGWVRDHLLLHPSSDIDIATDAPPKRILDLFSQTILVGLSFGVVVVILDGMHFEVATFRKDLGYTDGRKPEQIELSTPQEDAQRRDFTINGMFYDPIEHAIYDYVGGAEDIKKKIIRTIGNPDERFVEDRLRMIRAIRFACRFDFAIDPETQEAIIQNAYSLFPAVAMERIWQELSKMSQLRHFDRALIELHRLQLLPVIFPLLEKVHLHDIKQWVSSFKYFPRNCPTALYLIVLFPKASLTTLLKIFQTLRVSNKDIGLVRLAHRCRQLILQNEAPALEWVHFYANPEADHVFRAHAATFPHYERMLLIESHEQRLERLNKHISRVIQQAPIVTGEMLKQQGIPQGKLLGTLLKEAEKLAIEQDIEVPEAILNKLKASHLWPTTT
jgi:poly(A) polymerase